MDDLTNEMIATALKYLNAKRQNLYTSLTSDEYQLADAQRDHMNGEVEDLNAVIGALEAERERRRLATVA